MGSPLRSLAHDDLPAGRGRRVMHRVRRVPALAAVLVAVTVVGAGWFAWDLVTAGDGASVGDRFDRVDSYVAAQMADARIPGVSLAIVEQGAVVHARGFGHDGRGHDVTADTPFWIGSNTKSVTALAVMQLAESGAVDLDAPVRTYLPEFRLADEAASAQITVRHLLDQTSGIARADGLRAVVDADPNDSIGDVVTRMTDVELNRPVGARFEYSNLNSVVLGAVVEAVTGDPWPDYVQTHVFDPLAMTHTHTRREAADADGLTATHRTFFGFPVRTDADHLPGLAPSGYVYSSANDMARYLTAHLDGGTLDGQRVLSATGIAEMLTPATDERTFPLQGHRFSARYGAGWFVGPFGAVDDARWHQGSLPHFTAWMVLLPDTEQAVVVLMNAGNQLEIAGANAAWSRLPQGIVNIVVGAEPPTGTGTSRFYIAFGTLVTLALVAQAWTLGRVATSRRHLERSALRRVAPLAWELVVAPLVLVGYPAVAGGLGWRAGFVFVPDLSFAVAAVAGFAVVTGFVRALRLVRSRTVTDDIADDAPDSTAAAPIPMNESITTAAR